MTRKELEELGLEKETIDKVMALNGQAINELKSNNETLQSEYDTLKAQHEELSKVDVQGLNSKLEALQGDYDTLKSEQEGKLLDTLKSHALDKIKLTSNVTDKKLFGMVLDSKVKELEFDTETNEFKGIDEVLETIETEHPSLSVQEKPGATGTKIKKKPIEQETQEDKLRKAMGL